ncbi:GNAT family N-acetyltransferase [Nakamurella sp. GG22]
MPTAEVFADPALFGDEIAPLVARDRVGATMVSHVLAGHRAQPYPGGTPLMVVVRAGGDVGLAAMRTPGHPALVVLDPALPAPGAVLDALVAALAATGEPVDGFSGRRATVLALAESWSRHTGAGWSTRMSTLFYRLESLVEPTGVPGSARAAILSDDAELDLLARWFDEFGRETGVARGLPAPDRAMVLGNAERGQLTVLWCVGRQPVALAGHSAVRNGVARIAPVYTPPEHRRRGYGAAATAAAVYSARELGAAEITLFADADYPPANAVYRGLGFTAVADFAHVECVPRQA